MSCDSVHPAEMEPYTFTAKRYTFAYTKGELRAGRIVYVNEYVNEYDA